MANKEIMNKKNKGIKLIKPEMEFNPGLQKYEVVLPPRKDNKKLKVGIDWKWIIILIIGIIIFLGGIFILIKSKLI